MVKVFGRRPLQGARLYAGRRTETAHARTRGQQAWRYGNLKDLALRCWCSSAKGSTRHRHLDPRHRAVADADAFRNLLDVLSFRQPGAYGGADMRDVFVTFSLSERLMKLRWPRPGLRLHYLDRVP